MREREKPKPLVFSRAVARFCHWYPGEFRDGEIGWLSFWELYDEIPSVQAEWRVNIAQAIDYALADEKHQQPFRTALDQAYERG